MSVCSGVRLTQHSQLNSSNTPTAIELKVVTETEVIMEDDEPEQMRTKQSIADDGRSVA